MTSRKRTAAGERVHRRERSVSRCGEMRLWTVLLALCNLSLLKGNTADALAFYPAEVAAGQWWRLLTFPFVHADGYSLILDAGAFLVLWAVLEEESAVRRAFYFAGSLLGCLLLPLWLSPATEIHGLCGLSGIAHGVMAAKALELVARCPQGSVLYRTGVVLFVGVVGESIPGALTAGVPVVEFHVGGVLGGMTGFFVARRLPGRGRQGGPVSGSFEHVVLS